MWTKQKNKTKVKCSESNFVFLNALIEFCLCLFTLPAFTSRRYLLLGVKSDSAETVPAVAEQVPLESSWTDDVEQALSSQETKWVNNSEEKLGNTATPHNSLDSQNLFIQSDSDQNRELSYEASTQSSFDPYGFKLSPEHSSHTLLDPDEAELSPEPAENDLTFDPEPSSSQPDQLDFDHYEFDITSSQMAQDSDPYGFKLSPEPENQEVLDLCSHDNLEAMDLFNYENGKQIEPSNEPSNQEVLEPLTPENQEVLELCSHNNQELLDLCNNGNQEVLDPFNLENMELGSNENQEFLNLCSHENQEVVEPYRNTTFENLLEPCNYDNQEVLEPCSHGSPEVLDISHPENQELQDFDNLDLCVGKDHELQGLGSHDNQEVLDLLSREDLPEANNNRCIAEPEVSVSPVTNSSDSDVASDDLLGLKLSNSPICTSNKTNTNTADSLVQDVHTSANQDFATSIAPISHNLLEGDLAAVFGAGGYIGCPDVADDLEPLERRQAKPVAEPVRPVRPVRPPRPSLRVS